MKKNKKSKHLSLTQILEQNPVSCENCSNFKTVKGNRKLYARCTLGLMETSKRYWAIEREFLCMPLGWREAEKCKHFAGEIYRNGGLKQ